MKRLSVFLVLLPVSAESLRYEINWPSGLSLGEATLRSDGAAAGSAKERPPWSFELNLDASVPGFAMHDDYRSRATAELCAIELNKDYAHGKRKGRELLTFDQQKNTVTREILNGGGSAEFSVSPCARDALAFLQFARRELAQGRLAPPQAVVLGGLYQVRLEYAGTQPAGAGPKRVDADRISAAVKGSSSDVTFEVWFARDAARTPVFARIPLPLGAITVELVR